MIYNPFDLVVPTTNHKAETYSAETILNSPFGVPLKLIGESTKERDTSKLCGSKHFVETWVSLGASDEETATSVGAMSEDKKYIVPGQSNIIVGFSPQDTSGGGKVQKWFEDHILGPIIQGLGVVWDVTTPLRLVVGDFISNPSNWVSDKEVRRETAVNIIDSVPQDSKTGSTLTAVGCTFTPWMSACQDDKDDLDRGLWSYFWAEEFKNETGTTTQLPDDTYWGTNYHNADAAAHKILVTITLERADGSIVQKHEKYISGSPEVYEEEGNIYQKPGLGVFAIDEPGTWTVTTSPIAWGACSNVDWSNTYTIEVPKPEWWDLETESAQEEEIETLTAQMNTKLEDLGLPTGLTVAAVAGIAITGVALLSYKILNRS
jgi:hypothetical protein|tara:strand:- start:2422 stop:3549 length:1128 start_codon:yes stop_codon:yes gene_type:complete